MNAAIRTIFRALVLLAQIVLLLFFLVLAAVFSYFLYLEIRSGPIQWISPEKNIFILLAFIVMSFMTAKTIAWKRKGLAWPIYLLLTFFIGLEIFLFATAPVMLK